jgi:hypothetical protein
MHQLSVDGQHFNGDGAELLAGLIRDHLRSRWGRVTPA